jgi:hypothetical protein
MKKVIYRKILNIQGFTITTYHPVKKGEELTICYDVNIHLNGDNPITRKNTLNERFSQCFCNACKDPSNMQPMEFFNNFIISSICDDLLNRRLCSWCGNSCTQSCSSCGMAYYCCKNCQVQHWKMYHKYRCNSHCK